MTLAIDYAWQHPNPAAIKADGYSVVMRYLSGDPSKNLTVAEATALHKAGLSIGLVWETSSSRAIAGARAGSDDSGRADQMADALGFPKACPIFYAVDFDATPGAIAPYFAGAASTSSRPIGVYGSYKVCEAMLNGHARYGWQTQAWSYDAASRRVLVSNRCHLFQRVKRTLGPIAGIADSAWDEDAVLAPFPLWSPGAGQVPTPPKPPVSRGGGHTVPPPKPRPVPRAKGLTVDGRMGPATVKAMQLKLGVAADGVFGLHTAEALQHHLGQHPDGDVGPITVRAAQRRWRASVDGVWPSVVRPHSINPKVVSDTTKHMQSAINGNRF